jgi:hypothetical protein
VLARKTQFLMQGARAVARSATIGSCSIMATKAAVSAGLILPRRSPVTKPLAISRDHSQAPPRPTWPPARSGHLPRARPRPQSIMKAPKGRRSRTPSSTPFLDQRLGGQIPNPAPAPEGLQPRYRVLQPVTAADGAHRDESGNRLAVPGDRDLLASLDALARRALSAPRLPHWLRHLP